MSAPSLSVVWPWSLKPGKWSVGFANPQHAHIDIHMISNIQFDTDPWSMDQIKDNPEVKKEYTSVWLNSILNRHHRITYKESPLTIFGHAHEPVTLFQDGVQVYQGDIARLCVGMWCHLSDPTGPFALTHQHASDLFKEDRRTKQVMGAKALLPNDCIRLLRSYMEPYKAQLRKGWQKSYVADHENLVVHHVDLLMPKFATTIEAANNLPNDELWMSWWTGGHGAVRAGGGDFLSLMMTNDGTANEKHALLQKLAPFVDSKDLLNMWKSADHATVLRRGLFQSWFAVAKACGIAEQNAITMQADTIVRSLYSLSEQPNTWAKYIPLFVANPQINRNLSNIVRDFCVVHLESPTAAKRCEPEKGWDLFRAANLVPQILTWRMVVDHYKSMGSALDRMEREQIVDAVLSSAHLHQHLENLLLPETASDQEQAAPAKKRRM